jgi:RNA polymerase sigma-70 factor (ECF subfamily)
MSAEMSDEQLIQRVRAGDRESYGVLASRHSQKLHGIARRYVRDSSEAEDVVQTAHLLALRHFDQYQGPSAYFQWMASITINEIRTRHRQNRLAVVYGEVPETRPAATPNPEQVATSREICRIVERAVDQLTPEYGLVFRLRALRECSTAETGRNLNISEACVKTRLRRARLMLQRAFDAGRRRTAGISRSGTAVNER